MSDFLIGKLPNPDITVSHRVTVVLQRDRPFVAMRLEVGYSVWTSPAGTSLQHDIVMDKHAVMKYDECRLSDDLVIFESRPVENDIIRLPLARLSAGVDQRNRPAVERNALAIGIGLVIVGIKNLDLIVCH